MLTVGDMLDLIRSCNDKYDADWLKDELIQLSIQQSNYNRKEATEIVYSNIGYAIGYLDQKERARLYSLFNLSHPIFGSI